VNPQVGVPALVSIDLAHEIRQVLKLGVNDKTKLALVEKLIDLSENGG
jgi:hypothetical protein